jgi:hypothetical protein
MTSTSETAYEQVMSRLTTYAHEDWLGLEILTRRLRKSFDHAPSYVELRPVAIRAVRDLINIGAVAGDITEEGFESWPVSRQEMIDRITRALEERDTWPGPDELGWITFPDAEHGAGDE